MILSWKGKFLASVNQNYPKKLFGTSQFTLHLQIVPLSFLLWILKSLAYQIKCFVV